MPRAKKSAAPKAAAPYNTGAPQPAAAPTGLPYGEHQQSIASQQALPAAGPSQTAPSAPPEPAPAPADPAALLSAAQGYNFQPVGLGPTARTNEPVTAGLPLGPGAGPETLGMPDPDVEVWRPYLPALEYMSSQPNSTITTRNFVRRLRSLMPPAPPQ